MWAKQKIMETSIVPLCAQSFLDPLPHLPILGFSNSAANKNMTKICTNEDTGICLSRKHCGKRRNCLLPAISCFPTMFPKAVYC